MFYLVRHGEPDYSEMDTKVYRGFGAQMCPLTQEGCVQIKNTAKNVQLQNAGLIISSPYGRLMQAITGFHHPDYGEIFEFNL